jgi:hypothetical protein
MSTNVAMPPSGGFANRVLPRAELQGEAFAYAARVAQNDASQLHTTKLAINQAEDMQGDTSHIVTAHSQPDEGRGAQGAHLPSGQRRIAQPLLSQPATAVLEALFGWGECRADTLRQAVAV